MNEEVLGFIGRFTGRGQWQQVIDAFNGGCCYWFANILNTRFEEYDPVIMYDPIINHFGVMIDGCVYDASGNVTDDFDWIRWSDMDDELWRDRIIRDCIMFER